MTRKNSARNYLWYGTGLLAADVLGVWFLDCLLFFEAEIPGCKRYRLRLPAASSYDRVLGRQHGVRKDPTRAVIDWGVYRFFWDAEKMEARVHGALCRTQAGWGGGFVVDAVLGRIWRAGGAALEALEYFNTGRLSGTAL